MNCPDWIIEEIFYGLELIDLISLSKTCKSFRQIVYNMLEKYLPKGYVTEHLMTFIDYKFLTEMRETLKIPKRSLTKSHSIIVQSMLNMRLTFATKTHIDVLSAFVLIWNSTRNGTFAVLSKTIQQPNDVIPWYIVGLQSPIAPDSKQFLSRLPKEAATWSTVISYKHREWMLYVLEFFGRKHFPITGAKLLYHTEEFMPEFLEGSPLYDIMYSAFNHIINGRIGSQRSNNMIEFLEGYMKKDDVFMPRAFNFIGSALFDSTRDHNEETELGEQMYKRQYNVGKKYYIVNIKKNLSATFDTRYLGVQRLKDGTVSVTNIRSEILRIKYGPTSKHYASTAERAMVLGYGEDDGSRNFIKRLLSRYKKERIITKSQWASMVYWF